ncbi:MAG: dienelactone hydrolase family protein, partial [Ktedonobacteraceae bacterium]
MTGNMVEFEAAGSNGRTATGYLAVPASGRGPGVLVLHAWWGLNEFFKSLCERLAGEGFVALAPDLYHGRTAASIDGAKQLMSTLNSDEASLDITGAIDYLLAQQATQGDKVG